MSKRRKIELTLTPAQARGCIACLGEGAAGLFSDANAALGYIGNRSQVRAAEAGVQKLQLALREIAGARPA